MESSFSVLDDVLSDNTLNSLIQSCSCCQALNSLLKLKHRRVLEGSCEKLHFSIDIIFNSNINVDLGVEILKTALLITSNNTAIFSQTVNYCLNKICSSQNSDEIYYAISLFNVILEDHKSERKIFTLAGNVFDTFQTGVVNLLRASVKPLVTFILIHVVPNYLQVCDKESKHCFLTKMFEFVSKEKKLEVLCMCYSHFIHSHFDNKFNLLECDDFWFLLTNCIVSNDHYMQKQAVYLLTKSIKTALSTDNLQFLPQYLLTKDANEMEKTWWNYFTLLDVSNEKQLHIIEPSLHMFSSVKKLDFLWRSCLYKIFLRHSQNLIVYNVAIFILQNETEWNNFAKIVTELLTAINKHEYNTNSQKVFQEMANFCQKLDNHCFNIFVSESLNVTWVPAAIWGLYSNIFKQSVNFKIPLVLVDKIIKNLKAIPHRFIRSACTRVVLAYFLKNGSFNCLTDFFKMSLLLRSSDDVCAETLFENFVKRNEEQIRLTTAELLDQFYDCLRNREGENSERFIIVLKILQILKIDFDFETVLQNKSNDLGKLLLMAQFYENNDIKENIVNRIGFCESFDYIAPLLLFTEKFRSEKLLEKASNILSTEVSSDVQKVLAFAIICEHGMPIHQFLKFYNDFQKISSNDERIASFFVKALLKSLSESCRLVELHESIIILENALDSYNVANTILENLAVILKCVGRDKVVQFIERCFKEYLNLNKNGNNSRATTEKFLSQLFHPYLLENDDFCKLLVKFCWQLLDISNSANSVAYILSERITNSIKQKPEKGCIFIPIIVELILCGIVINKKERVDYYVCQEIGLTVPTDNNPNLEEVSTRLLALESMLFLINQKSHHEHNKCEKFVSHLVEKYKKNFSKRYFPDSQIHLEKLRLLQTLLLLHGHMKNEKSTLIDLLVESFLQETHQPSVKHLMQWLLIKLIRNDSSYIQTIQEKLKEIDNNRPSAVSGLIPVLYHVIVSHEETQWDQLIEVLLPYCMGAQFKLRIFSQVALTKLYNKALKTQNIQFLEKYKTLHSSLKQVIEAIVNANFDVANIHHEFLDYFSLENCDYSTVLHTIPKNNGVTEIEWKNLLTAANQYNFKHVKFSHCDNKETPEHTASRSEILKKHNDNIQKKITPWKDLLDTSEASIHTNNFILVTSLIEKPANLGGLSRTCEVFGIKKMVMRTSKITADKEFKSLSMSSENWVDISDVKVEELQDFILGVKKEGYCVVGAEQTSESVKLDQFHFPKMTVLLLGNEKEGIPANLIPLLDKCVEIPQFGMVRSLNVHVAGAIMMWEYCKQHKL